MITIGIPFYNPGKYFKESIQSILLQSYTDFELILLDDGSTDDSLKIAHSFQDKRIKIVSDGLNLGLPARLNQIIDMASGKYIARMDADDLVSTERLAKQVEFLDHNIDIDLVSTGICSITYDSEIIAYRLPSAEKSSNLTVNEGILGTTGIAHATIMARRDWCIRNRYDEKIKLIEDYQLWLEASFKGDLKVGFIKEALYFYREESSIEYKKVMRAYKTKLKINLERYKATASKLTIPKLYFYLYLKLAICFLLNKFGLLKKLIPLRNRGNKQSSKTYSYIVGEIKKIQNFKHLSI
ncbi:glycosyltransferase family 2 protein [Thalassotalea fonticola]|uniref:Glycosyltransferase family 2 protein n=1 Tax=Thalassotalea fonticola TaxID=3065649 RepID=A0ABZ0GTE8_9GAMM|nr:glycosyltransferase family 2 protein [Colwelliaceae bacterium S1-1]